MTRRKSGDGLTLRRVATRALAADQATAANPASVTTAATVNSASVTTAATVNSAASVTAAPLHATSVSQRRAKVVRPRRPKGVKRVPAGTAEVDLRWGRLPWNRVVAPAVSLARSRVVLPAGQSRALVRGSLGR